MYVCVCVVIVALAPINIPTLPSLLQLIFLDSVLAHFLLLLLFDQHSLRHNLVYRLLSELVEFRLFATLLTWADMNLLLKFFFIVISV